MVMTFRCQVKIINAAIVGALRGSTARGAPLISLETAGIGLPLLANTIFWSRWSRRKKAGIGAGQVEGLKRRSFR
jgi:hypothetical protein